MGTNTDFQAAIRTLQTYIRERNNISKATVRWTIHISYGTLLLPATDASCIGHSLSPCRPLLSLPGSVALGTQHLSTEGKTQRSASVPCCRGLRTKSQTTMSPPAQQWNIKTHQGSAATVFARTPCHNSKPASTCIPLCIHHAIVHH